MRTLLTTLMALCCAMLSAQQGANVLLLHTSDGQPPRQLLISDIDSLSIDGRDIVASMHGGTRLALTATTLDSATFARLPHPAIDLGLSVQWASCNVGATKPHQYGNLYAWGEVVTKTNYSEQRYAYFANDQYQYIGVNISGTDHDAATRQWADGWRMPTRAEANELATRCTWRPDTLHAVSGWRVTGPSGQSIFLPSTGYQDGPVRHERGQQGYYWTGTLNTAMPSTAYNINFRGYDAEWSACRAYGFAIRPVHAK